MGTILEYLRSSFLWGMLASNRFKSFYWRAGAMVFTGLLGEAQAYFTAWDPQAWQTVLAGLVIAEITKALSKAANP